MNYENYCLTNINKLNGNHPVRFDPLDFTVNCREVTGRQCLPTKSIYVFCPLHSSTGHKIL